MSLSDRINKHVAEQPSAALQQAHTNNTILHQAIEQDRSDRLDAAEKVAKTQALKPTKEELEHCDRITKLISQRFSSRISKEGLTDYVKREISLAVQEEIRRIYSEYEEQERLKKIILSSMFGLGPLEIFMRPESQVTDIIVQRFDSIYIEDETGLHKADAEFNSEQHLRNVIERIVQRVGRQINLITPAVDAKLEDGSRIHATIPPITPDGATLTIRRFNNRKLEASDYLALGTLNKEMLDFLEFCVKAKMNILVSGGTGSGKTTLLNMLSSFIPDNELIITIEDNCELQLKQPNVRRMEARQGVATQEASYTSISIQDLVRHSLRMRPDRIIVGEVRDGCVVDMLTAMSTGHEGSMSTVHSDSPRALVDSRLPSLFSQYNASFSKETQALMTAEAIQLIVQISRERDFSRKITHITAVNGIDEKTGELILTDIFTYDRNAKTFVQTKLIPTSLIKLLEGKGFSIPSVLYGEG